MLFVYTDFNINEIKLRCNLDLSKISAHNLADECDNIFIHHTDSKLFLGFLEPGFMLDPKHEARIRKCIRKFECHLICFHLESLPFSWKNEIDSVFIPKIEKE